jgi:plastocyanin
MTMCVRTALGGTLALAIAAASPVAAQAATKSVDMGLPLPSQKTFQSTGSDVNDFFPHRVTIHVGDRIRFVPTGFHTVDLPGRRTSKLAVITPTGQPIAGSTDAAGAPFWFNGQSGLTFNPLLLASGFGKSRSYTGAKAVLSGFPLAQRPKPMTVRFTRTGTFRYFCDVHLGMTGFVRVVSARRSVPSAAADRATVRRQVATTLRIARALPNTGTVPANTVDVGRQGAGNVSLFAFLPATLTVPRGTTVTFRMNARSEIHTATSGPGNPENEPTSYLGQIAASLNGPSIDPKALYPSEAPGALAALTPVFHGNGFWNSGALDLDSATPTVPTSNRVTFAAPGTYQVYCMIHPFMHGTVTVT